MPRKRVRKYAPAKDDRSNNQIANVTEGLAVLRDDPKGANTISNVSAMLDALHPAKVVTAADLGRMAADMLVKEAKLTIMSRTVPASESENAHKDIMENRGAVQNPHRYGRKPQQPKSDAE